MPTMQTVVALSIVAITSGGEARRGVDDDVVEHLAQRRVDLAQELDRDDRGVIGPARGDQHLDTRRVRHQEPSSFSSSSEPPVRTRSKIVDLGRQAHRQADVAELEVEVDEGDASCRTRRGRRRGSSQVRVFPCRPSGRGCR